MHLEKIKGIIAACKKGKDVTKVLDSFTDTEKVALEQELNEERQRVKDYIDFLRGRLCMVEGGY